MVERLLTDEVFSVNKDYIDRGKLILIAFISNLGALLLGFDYGVTSYLLLNISYFSSSSEYSKDVYFSYADNNSVIQGLIASGAAIGAALMYATLMFFGNSVSKKDEMAFASFLYFIGALLESNSYYFNWEYSGGLIALIFGRLIFGAGIATSLHSSPQYVAEMAPAEVRGNIGSATEVMVGCGTLFGYVLGFVSNTSDGWAQIYLVGYLLALVMGCLTLFIPHSPAWMVRHKYSKEDVLEAVHFLYPEATEERVTQLRQQHEIEKEQNSKIEEIFTSKYEREYKDSTIAFVLERLPNEFKLLMFDKVLYRCLSYGIWLAVLNIGTGHTAILYYAGSIFDEVCSNVDGCILGLGLAKLLPAVLMLSIADVYGRRTLLMVGIVIVTLGLIIISSGFGSNTPQLTIVGMYMSIAGWEIGFGTMVWFILQELFPYYVRPAGTSLILLILTITSTIIIFILPTFKNLIGYFGCFLFFTIIGFLAFTLIYFFQPETRGVELEAAHKLLNARVVKVSRSIGYQTTESDDESESLLATEPDLSVVENQVTPIML